MEEFYKKPKDLYIFSYVDGKIFCEYDRHKIYKYNKIVKNEEQAKYLCKKMSGRVPKLNKYWKLISIST
mgnify:CR=1 FL=1|tara:strand:+ start:1021 stop:1227 length:207 start_codon:yes stop_codon:yes gene_type:complete